MNEITLQTRREAYDGLLELDGLLTEDEAKTHADGLGYLTAGNVLERILQREGER